MQGVAVKSHVLPILYALAAGILLLPLEVSAQTSAKVYRIGCLDTTPPDLRSPNQMAFYEELRKRGYVEGQNLVVERRNAAGRPDQLPALAGELVALRPDLIVASAPQPATRHSCHAMTHVLVQRDKNKSARSCAGRGCANANEGVRCARVR